MDCHQVSITLYNEADPSTADQEHVYHVGKVITCPFALLCFYIVKFFLAAFHVWEIKVMRLCRRLGLYWLVHMCWCLSAVI